jgi:hypothetical protein
LLLLGMQDPELLIRLPGSITRNWEGICQVLQLSPEEAVLLLQRAPLLMNNRPEAVQERYSGIQRVLQVGGQGRQTAQTPWAGAGLVITE